MPYSSLTVAQLKDVLKEKHLSTDGKKADLLARLTAADAEAETNTEELESTDGPQAKDSSVTPQNELLEYETAETTDAFESVKSPTLEAEAQAEAEAGNETVAQDVQDAHVESEEPEKPQPKVLTPEEKKQLAVDLLTKKIQRAEKFGDEASAASARKDLARVEKFGLDPATALGKEINGLSSDVHSELGGKKHRRHSKKNRNNRRHKVSKK